MSFSTNSPTNTRFLVAKYIPDMRRLEPRNIGVIVWNSGTVSARFLGEDDSGASSVTIPRRLRVHNKDAYGQWINYWREQMMSRSLSVNGNGQSVSRDCEEFLDALIKRSRKQFVLVDGGFISGNVDVAEIGDVTRDLFEALVDDGRDTRETTAEDAVLLKKEITNAFHASGLDRTNGYQYKTPLAFRVADSPLSFTFDYAVYTTAPRVVFQHALLTRPTTVNSAAFMFGCIQKADYEPYRLAKDRCFALIRTTPQTMDHPNAEGEVNKLKLNGTVIDLAETDRAISDLQNLAMSL